MLAGVKIIPRDQIDQEVNPSAPRKQKQKHKKRGKEDKRRRNRKSSRYSSSDGEDLERIQKGSRKKWYSSDESSSSSYSSGSESEGSSDGDRRKSTRKGKRSAADMSGDEVGYTKRSRSGKKEYISEDHSSSGSDSEEDSDSYSDRKGRHKKGRRNDVKKKNRKRSQGGMEDEDLSGDARGTSHSKKGEIARKEIGLEWMLRPEGKSDRIHKASVEEQPKEIPTEEVKVVNPRELNPYLKGEGSGYPEDSDEAKAGGNPLVSSSGVGDGGASWRLKALKRAKEQATREGRKLQEVVGERWGSLGELTVSVASNKSAQSRAHLHAIQSRKKGLNQEHQPASNNQSDMDNKKDTSRHYLKDVSLGPKMREPKVRDSLSWKKRKSEGTSTRDSDLIADAVSSLNAFSNDGSFMSEVLHKRTDDFSSPVKENVADTGKPGEVGATLKGELNANQLAAKAFQLRMKGKHEEAKELLQVIENMKAKQADGDDSVRPQNQRITSRYAMQDKSFRQKKKEDDGDMHLAQTIMQNKKYSISGKEDDEYDFDGGPSRKSKKKQGTDDNKAAQNTFAKRFSIQQERCLFCFENPRRPAHLVVAIANFSYLMLPQQQPVVPGHCCILPMQHVPSTRTVDDDVWQEIRNFKKCLIMMFAKQEKEVVFLETVMGLAQQRRHCIVECIPLPGEIAKEAPLYFKKAIDEAEDEWSQHNAKKLIDTSVKGLRGSIPKDFPYFHVEFGLNKGFVHVIDDEKEFNSNLGLNVIRGMLELPEEDMYRRRRHETVEAQKQAVKSFDQDWAPFDWTKQLR